jgi:hypothetical protein
MKIYLVDPVGQKLRIDKKIAFGISTPNDSVFFKGERISWINTSHQAGYRSDCLKVYQTI